MKPTIDVGDAIQKSKLPGWLRWIFSWFRGVKVSTGPVDISLNEEHGLPPARTGLDAPHTMAPPPLSPRDRRQ